MPSSVAGSPETVVLPRAELPSSGSFARISLDASDPPSSAEIKPSSAVAAHCLFSRASVLARRGSASLLYRLYCARLSPFRRDDAAVCLPGHEADPGISLSICSSSRALRSDGFVRRSASAVSWVGSPIAGAASRRRGAVQSEPPVWRQPLLDGLAREMVTIGRAPSPATSVSDLSRARRPSTRSKVVPALSGEATLGRTSATPRGDIEDRYWFVPIWGVAPMRLPMRARTFVACQKD